MGLVSLHVRGWHLKSCVALVALSRAAALEELTLPEMSSGVLNSLLGGVAAIWCYPQVALPADLAAVAAAPPAVWHSTLVAIEELTLTDLSENKQWRRADGGNLCPSMNAV